MGDFAEVMAPYIGKKAVIHELEPDGGDGYWKRRYYLGRLVAVTWDEKREAPTFEFDREGRYYMCRGKYFSSSSSDWKELRFKDEKDEEEGEDLREMELDGYAEEDFSYDISVRYIAEDYKSARKRAREDDLAQTRIRQQRYIEQLEKTLDNDGVIQLREGQIQVSKKFLSVVSPVFKQKFASADIIQMTDHDPADVELFIQLLTGKVLPPSGMSKLVNLVKLFDAFQAGSILQCVPGCRENISKDCAERILQIKPAVADDELLEMCRQISAAKRKKGL